MENNEKLWPALTDLEVISMRGIQARQLLAQQTMRIVAALHLSPVVADSLRADYDTLQLEITRDLAIIFGEIETRLNIEGGTIIKGGYQMTADGRLAPGVQL